LPLSRGEGVVVSEVFSSFTGLGIGDMYREQVESVQVALPILGVIRDYRTNGGVVFVDHGGFSRRYFDPGWSGVRLFFRRPPADADRALDDLRREVVEKCGAHLDMINGAALREEVLRIFDETFAVTTVLLLIALVIAALGIATTLAVQVLERSRQLNTLFAVGAGFGQIRAMVFWEALLLVLAGEFAGLLCGLMLSYILIYVVNIQSFGWSFLYRVDWQALALSLPLIVGTALLSALPAVRLIFRKPPAALLRER
jgi:putative ABC transport system permease protein